MDGDDFNAQVARAGRVVRARDVDRLPMSRSGFYAMARRGGWRSEFPHAWIPPHVEIDGLVRARAALASLGHGEAWLARSTVLWLLDLVPFPPDEVQLVVPDRRQPVARTGARVVRSRTLRPDERTTIRGLPCTTLARAVRDLCAERWPPDRLLAICLDALQSRKLFLDDLREQRRRMSRGCTGTGELDLLIAELEIDGSDSIIEKHGRRLVAPLGVTPYPRPFPWRAADGVVDHLDMAFHHHWVAIMCDSRSFHGTGPVFTTDRRAWNSLAGDWRLFWLTSTIIREGAQEFVAAVGQALAAASPDRPSARPVVCHCSRCLTRR